jgi:plastocyanin
VTVADTTAPTIVLLGEPAVEIELDASYEDAGATATDTVDGLVEVVTTGSVDTSAAATYALTYTATDGVGNVATTTRTVIVKEPSAETINVSATNNGGWAYIIDGVSKPEITLEVGTTYTFKYPASHPLRFSTVSDGIFNGGAEYTQGVDTSVANQITIRVTSSTAQTLYYYCRIHARQGGIITIK